MSPALSRSSALYHVKLGDALEIRNGIIFDFYWGLPTYILFSFYLPRNFFNTEIGSVDEACEKQGASIVLGT